MTDHAIFVMGRFAGDAVLAAVTALGRTVVAAEANAEPVTVFVDSGASAAIIDLRDTDLAPADVAAFAGAAALSQTALIVIAEPDNPALSAAIEAGATHHIPVPFGQADVERALILADRFVERVRGGGPGRRTRGAVASTLQDEGSALAALDRWLASGPGTIGVLRVGFSRFEMINSAFGRKTGDALIEAIAGRLGTASAFDAERSALTRIGGTEFALLFDGIAPERQARIAEQVITALSRPFLAEGHMVSLDVRIGSAAAATGDTAIVLLSRAARALAIAQAPDGAPIMALSGDDDAVERLDQRLAEDLRGALDRDEIELLFQPQVAITTGAIVGVEALARWHHPDHGELGAATLFAVAERSDYIAALSAHIQRKAVRIAAAWPPSLAKMRLAINLTAADIARPDFVASFFALVDASGFPRSRLTVEITETGLIADLERAAGLLAALRAGGCRVAIDDFGTGYSSLAYLKALPLDYLKLDTHMSRDITGSSRDRIVVHGVIEMARSLGLAVIAEGIETEEQLQLLAAEGCNYYQGFLCAEPLGVTALDTLVAAA